MDLATADVLSKQHYATISGHIGDASDDALRKRVYEASISSHQ